MCDAGKLNEHWTLNRVTGFESGGCQCFKVLAISLSFVLIQLNSICGRNGSSLIAHTL